MKTLKTYKQLFESNSEMNLITVLEKIMSGELQPQEIKNHIDDIEYDKKFTDYINTYDDDEFDNNFLEISLKKFDLAYFESLMDLDKGILKWIEHIDTYNYDYNVDDSEIEYIDNNLNDSITKKMKNFANELNFDYDDSDENICYKFVKEYNLLHIKDTYLSELSSIKEKATVKRKKVEIDDVTPIYFDYEIFTISYENAVDFLKTNKFTDVMTIFDLFDKIGENIPYSYEIEYENYEYENYDNFEKDIEASVDFYWDDEIGIIEDRYFIDILSEANTSLELVQKIFNNIDWFEKIKYYSYGYKYYVDIILDGFNEKLKTWLLSSDFISRLEDYAKVNDIEIKNEELYLKISKMRKAKVSADFNL